MSLWGVVENHETHERHVLPVGADGELLNGHVAARDCYCKPRQDEEAASVLIHNDPERGGFNS